MKRLLEIMLLLCSVTVASAQTDIRGLVMDATGKPLKFATVSLLDPSDSTLKHFGISKESGVVEIKKVNDGAYLLQTAMLGYGTLYKSIEMPVKNNDVGVLIMDKKDVEMDGVEIVGEKIPMLINKDTIEYNAGAFKTKSDANVEELLKKLPGVEVDRAGNIKAQGENVNKVFVDGKEFFGNDPKVATRNLPADAINKVQVFDKMSDAAEFTGIDDGSRERSINLKLKEDKKNGYFGDVMAGGGTDERYKGSGKLYRFRPETQLAVLGMFNNINRSGFSFNDYLNFSGGLQGLMSGNSGMSLELSSDDNIPVNFGQPVTGLVTSGAGGLNYSYAPSGNKRLSVSYMGNGSEKKLEENTYSQNFTDAADYETNSVRKDRTLNYAHRLNVSVRNDIDSQSQVMFNANASTVQNNFSSSSESISQVQDVILNRQSRNDDELGTVFKGASGVSFTNRSDDGENVLRLSANGNYKRNFSESEWDNMTSFLGQRQSIVNNQFRNDKIWSYDYGGSVSWSHALGKGYYLSPDLVSNFDNEHINRTQGVPPGESDVIDTLSPDFNRSYIAIRPGLTFRKATKKIQYSAAVRYEHGMLSQYIDSREIEKRNYNYILPSATWRNQYARGKHIDVSYRSNVEAPGYQQLMNAPVISSPLSVYKGNEDLVPEYQHNLRAGWMVFDQFSFTSFFANISGQYTHNKISRSVTINPDLSQASTMVNVPDDYNARAGFQFGKPIRALGIKTQINFSETYNRGITIINGQQNIAAGFTHDLSVKISNRKKDKWDAELGVGINLTDINYSVEQSMDNVYYNTSVFAELSYKPNEHWYFMVAADVTDYNARSFRNSVTIPLLRSEMSYYFLKGNRGVLTLEGFDILNQNKGIQRISQQNYLAEVRSNIIGQYFMLSFKYRISKAGKSNGGMIFNDIDVDIR